MTCAYASGDAHGEAAALGELGQILTRQGRYHDALDHLHRALEVDPVDRRRAREATTLNSLSIAYSRLGDTDQALEYLDSHWSDIALWANGSARERC